MEDEFLFFNPPGSLNCSVREECRNAYINPGILDTPGITSIWIFLPIILTFVSSTQNLVGR